MTRTTPPLNWLDQIFAAKAAHSGGVIRRRSDWIAREIGRDRFGSEVRRRGFNLIETGHHMIVICHSGEIRLLF
ncbi:N-(5'-phosphoribosyl)anthranilate isomerase [Loktanella sp. R86503]|uniref:N-(5'-phosphoribosyl)anthranilate isomerase n=1 Tax=Loktanella sp. R86503 TaxID=3093847 RepID=UPI0036DA0F9B